MNALIEHLPTLGVGASLSLSAEPDPLSLVVKPGGPSFVEYAGVVDVAVVIDEVRKIREAGAAILYHPSYINFCGSHANSPPWLAATAEHIKAVGSPWFAQDCAYCFWREGPGYATQLGYFIPPIFNQASIERAAARIREVQAAVPVPVAIEPPPVTFVAGSIPLFAYFGELARLTDCALLLDMGHLVSYEMASGRAVRDALDALPRERVIEVHVAGGRIRESQTGPIYIDAHEGPIQERTWEMFASMLPELPNVKAVCYECEGVEEADVLPTLGRIRELVAKRSASERLVASLDGENEF